VCLKRINCELTFYYQYVDNIVMAAPSDKTDYLIFNMFNDYHDRIKFTIEHEKSRSLNFLDLFLIISDNTIHIDFHKKTFSGRFLSFYSSHPLCHKIDMMYGLIDRAFLLSHPSYHQKNIELVIELLLENGYPLNLIFEKINNKTLIKRHGSVSRQVHA